MGGAQGWGGFIPREFRCLSSEASQAEAILEAIPGYIHILHVTLSCLWPNIYVGKLLGQSLFGDSQDPDGNFPTFFFLFQ